MRIVQEDAKLGVTKVIWRFAQKPEAAAGEAGPQDMAPAVPEGDPLEALTEGLSPEAGPQPEAEAFTEPESGVRTDFASPESGHLEDLRQQIRFLQQVVEAQNQQLRTKDELIRNFQVLLKSEQDQVLRLEAARSADKQEAPESAVSPASPEGRRFLSWLIRKPGR